MYKYIFRTSSRDQAPRARYSMRFRLRASSGSSSSARSCVSAGFSSEWTLEAMLERRVGGPGVSMPLKGYRAPGSDQLLSALKLDGVVSLVKGGVP
jgi:hypothetical protein